VENAEALLGPGANLVVLELTRRRDQRPIGAVAGADEAGEVRLLEGLDRFGAAADRLAEGAVGPEVLGEEIVDELVRRVLALQDLLQDDGALAIDLLWIETRVQENVGQDILGDVQMLAEDLGVVTGVFFAGEGVDEAADGVDLLGDLRRAATLG